MYICCNVCIYIHNCISGKTPHYKEIFLRVMLSKFSKPEE